jgi:peptidoglycan/LPS O-acetylase OafA/YrhL
MHDRLPALDGVRALAVLGVIASHSGLFGLGWLGVDVFFGLSGYLITGILIDGKAAATSARGYFVPFYLRRSLRILPLAWAVLILMAGVRGEWSGFWWYLGYLVNWLPQSPPPRDLGHYWSLAVEEQFYLVWPAIVFFSSSRTLWRATLAIFAIDIAFRFGVSMWPPAFVTPQLQDLATLTRADTLAVGALLAQRERNGGWGRELSWALPLCLLAAAAVVSIYKLEQFERLPLLTYNIKWPAIAVGVWGGLLFVLTQPPRALQWRWLVWIGQVSYGIYIIHALFGGWLHSRFTLSQAPLIFVLQLAVTLPLAAASWYLFEGPILRQKRRWPMPSRRLAREAVE